MSLYSQRNKNPKQPLNYDSISEKLGIQICRIWEKFINDRSHQNSMEKWRIVRDAIAEEHGKDQLVNSFLNYNARSEIRHYFTHLDSIDLQFDVIEMMFRAIDAIGNEGWTKQDEAIQASIDRLNERFEENDFGYRLRNGIIIRLDSKPLHRESVDRTLNLLTDPLFKNVNDEFSQALKDHKNGVYENALTGCVRAFESTMKIIAHEMCYVYDDSWTSKRLVKMLLDEGFVPGFMQNQLSALRNLMESSVPTTRNKMGGHGKGAKKTIVPKSLSTLTIYQTGSMINFFVERFEEIKPS